MATKLLTQEVGQYLANKIKVNQSSITTVQAAIDVLNGIGAGSVEKTVADKIAEIVANAPADLDTLREISDWITSHANDASAMNSQIQTNMTNIMAAQSSITVLRAAVKNLEDNALPVDTGFSETSENPVQNKVVKQAFDSINSTIQQIQENTYDDTSLVERITNLETAFELVTAQDVENWFENGSSPTVLAPGTYDANGNMLKTWAELFEGSGAGGRFVANGALHGSEEEWPNMDGAVTVVVDPSISSFGGSGVSGGTYQFCLCESLVSIVLPDTLSDLGEYGAFCACTNLSSITIPEGVKEVPDACFSACSSLTDVHLPDGLKSIGNTAFSDCTSLTEITIPDSVTSVGEDVFMGCTNLTTIYYSGPAEGAPWCALDITVIT